MHWPTGRSAVVFEATDKEGRFAVDYQDRVRKARHPVAHALKCLKRPLGAETSRNDRGGEWSNRETWCKTEPEAWSHRPGSGRCDASRAGLSASMSLPQGSHRSPALQAFGAPPVQKEEGDDGDDEETPGVHSVKTEPNSKKPKGPSGRPGAGPG